MCGAPCVPLRAGAVACGGRDVARAGRVRPPSACPRFWALIGWPGRSRSRFWVLIGWPGDKKQVSGGDLSRANGAARSDAVAHICAFVRTCSAAYDRNVFLSAGNDDAHVGTSCCSPRVFLRVGAILEMEQEP